MSKMMFEKTKIQTDFSKLMKLIYGVPKSGKTSLAACQTDKTGKPPLFIATEDGHNALEVYCQRVTSWEGFKKLVDLLVKETKTVREQHSCLIVDLVSDLDNWCGEFVAKKFGKAHIADLDYGKGFSLQKQEFQTVIRQLFEVLPITFVCHGAEKEMMWNGEKIKTQAPSLSKGCLEYINGKVDVIMWMSPANTRKMSPEVSMKNTTTSIAGTRYRQLARNFVLDVNDPSKTYGEIQKVFANEKDAVLEQEDSVKKENTAGHSVQAVN